MQRSKLQKTKLPAQRLGIHSAKPLQDSIQEYAKFPIATEFHDKAQGQRQPRLLVFSVDVAEGVTVAFDSYPKADGSRKSEYCNHVINYNDGVTIDHLMASNTLPEFYHYAQKCQLLNKRWEI